MKKYTLPLVFASLTLVGCQGQFSINPTTPVSTQSSPGSSMEQTTAAVQILPSDSQQSVPPKMSKQVDPAKRVQFGSNISPDGSVLLGTTFEDSENPTEGFNKRTHTLVTQDPVSHQTMKTLLKVDEYLNLKGDAAYKNNPVMSDWYVAGWSEMGKHAYYVTSNYKDGLGGFYPWLAKFGQDVYEVDVEAGTSKNIYSSQGDGIASGVVDFYPTQSALLETVAVPADMGGNTLYLKKLGGESTKLFEAPGKDNYGITAALFGPNGVEDNKYFVQTYEQGVDKDGDQAYNYRLFVVDGSGKATEVKVPYSSWLLQYVNEDGKSVQVLVTQDDGSDILQTVQL